MTVAEAAATVIRLDVDCRSDECARLALPLYSQLSSGRYTWPASVMPLPDTIADWEAEHRTARKRANACERAGYRFLEIHDRRVYTDDIYEINTSSESRQGRPMSAGYLERPVYGPPETYGCPRHRRCYYGVTDQHGRLRAYTWVERSGDLVIFSQILGHDAHHGRHIMYLLVRGALEDQARYGPGVCFYNRHDSGTDGLRFYKERLGFQPARVEWRR